eukprot:8879596-Pyramimonas_sp.AAC.3
MKGEQGGAGRGGPTRGGRRIWRERGDGERQSGRREGAGQELDAQALLDAWAPLPRKSPAAPRTPDPCPSANQHARRSTPARNEARRNPT